MTCGVCDRPIRSDNRVGLCKRHRHATEGSQKSKRNHLSRRRTFIDELKLTAGCADCGYSRHSCALDFDHLPGAVKLFPIGRFFAARSLAVLLTEIEKCEVVCANCHRVRTEGRREVP